jgi:hypothetical protein
MQLPAIASIYRQNVIINAPDIPFQVYECFINLATAIVSVTNIQRTMTTKNLVVKQTHGQSLHKLEVYNHPPPVSNG